MKNIRIILINVLAVVLGVSLFLFTACNNKSENNIDSFESGFFTGESNIYSLLDNYTINDNDTLAFDGLTLDLGGKTLNLNNKVFQAKSTKNNNIVISNGTIKNGEVILGSKGGQVQLENVTFDDSVKNVKLFGDVVLSNMNFGSVELVQVDYDGTKYVQTKEIDEETIDLDNVTINEDVSIGRLTISAPVNAQIKGFVADVVFEECANYSYLEATINSNIANIYVGAENVFLNISDDAFVDNIRANGDDICLSTCAPEHYVELVDSDIYDELIKNLKDYSFVSSKAATCKENGYVKLSYVDGDNTLNSKFITKATHVYGNPVKVASRYDFWKVNEYVCECCGHKSKTIGDTSVSIDSCDNLLELLTIAVPDFNYDFNLDAGTKFGNITINGGYVHILSKNGKLNGSIVAKINIVDEEKEIVFKGYIKDSEIYVYGKNLSVIYEDINYLVRNIEEDENGNWGPFKFNLYNFVCSQLNTLSNMYFDRFDVEYILDTAFTVLKNGYKAMNVLATASYDLEYLANELGEELNALIPYALWTDELSNIEFFTTEVKANSTVYTLTFDSLYNEIDKLTGLLDATGKTAKDAITVRNLIDICYPVEEGEDKTSELFAEFVISIPEITVNDLFDFVIDFADRSGVDKQRLFNIINNVCEAAMGEDEEGNKYFDIILRGDIRTLLESDGIGYLTINEIIKNLTYVEGDTPEEDTYFDLSSVLVRKNVNYILDSTVKELSTLAKDYTIVDVVDYVLTFIDDLRTNISFSYEIDNKDSIIAVDLLAYDSIFIDYDVQFEYNEDVKTVVSQKLDAVYEEEIDSYVDNEKYEELSGDVLTYDRVTNNGRYELHFDYITDKDTGIAYVKNATIASIVETTTQGYQVVGSEIDSSKDTVTGVPSKKEDVIKILDLNGSIVEYNGTKIMVYDNISIDLGGLLTIEYKTTSDNGKFTGVTIDVDVLDGYITFDYDGVYDEAKDFVTITGLLKINKLPVGAENVQVGEDTVSWDVVADYVLEFSFDDVQSSVNEDGIFGLWTVTLKGDTYRKDLEPEEKSVIATLNQTVGKESVYDEELNSYSVYDVALTTLTYNHKYKEEEGVLTFIQTQGLNTVDVYDDEGEISGQENIYVVLNDLKYVSGGFIFDAKQFNNEVLNPTEESIYVLLNSIIVSKIGVQTDISTLDVSNFKTEDYYFEFSQKYEQDTILNQAYAGFRYIKKDFSDLKIEAKYIESIDKNVITKDLSNIILSYTFNDNPSCVLVDGSMLTKDGITNGTIATAVKVYSEGFLLGELHTQYSINEVANENKEKDTSEKIIVWTGMANEDGYYVKNFNEFNLNKAYNEIGEDETKVGKYLYSATLETTSKHYADDEYEIESSDEVVRWGEKYTFKYNETLYANEGSKYGEKLGSYFIRKDTESKYYDEYIEYIINKYVFTDGEEDYILNKILINSLSYDDEYYSNSSIINEFPNGKIVLVKSDEVNQDTSTFDAYNLRKKIVNTSMTESMVNGERRYDITRDSNSYYSGLITKFTYYGGTSWEYEYDFDTKYDRYIGQDLTKFVVTNNGIIINEESYDVNKLATTYLKGITFGNHTTGTQNSLSYYYIDPLYNEIYSIDEIRLTFDIDLFDAVYYMDFSTIDDIVSNLQTRKDIVELKWNDSTNFQEVSSFRSLFDEVLEVAGLGEFVNANTLKIEYIFIDGYYFYGVRYKEDLDDWGIIEINKNDWFSEENPLTVHVEFYDCEESVLVKDTGDSEDEDTYLVMADIGDFDLMLNTNLHRYYYRTEANNELAALADLEALGDLIFDYTYFESTGHIYSGKDGKYGVELDLIIYEDMGQSNIIAYGREDDINLKTLDNFTQMINNGQIMPTGIKVNLIYENKLFTYLIDVDWNTNNYLYSLDPVIRERELHDYMYSPSIYGKIGFVSDEEFDAQLNVEDPNGLIKELLTKARTIVSTPLIILNSLNYTEGTNNIFDIKVLTENDLSEISVSLVNGVVVFNSTIEKTIIEGKTEYSVKASYLTNIVIQDALSLVDNNTLVLNFVFGFGRDEDNRINNIYFVPYYFGVNMNGYLVSMSYDYDENVGELEVVFPSFNFKVEIAESEISGKFDFMDKFGVEGGFNFDVNSEIGINPVESVFGIIEEDIYEHSFHSYS